MTIPVTVLGGYLGAGKTTLLNAMLAAEFASSPRRVAVVVNDFGAVNIDAALIIDRSATRIDLANGCVCCQIGDDLGDVFFTLRDTRPPFDHIVVETSGVADPATVASWASLRGLRLDGVVVAIDPESIERLVTDVLVGPTIRRQLRAADLAVLTRADDCPDALSDEVFVRAEEVARAHGLSCPVVRSGRGRVPVAALIDVADGDQSQSREARQQPRPDSEPHTPDDHGADVHVAARWIPDGPVDVDVLRRAVGDVPGLVRAKGFVRVRGDDREAGPEYSWCLVQVVGRRVSVEVPVDAVTDRSGVEGLVGIGLRGVFDTDHFTATLRPSCR